MLDFTPRQWLVLALLTSLLIFLGGMLMSQLDAEMRADPERLRAASQSDDAPNAHTIESMAAVEASSLSQAASADDAFSTDELPSTTIDASFEACKLGIVNVATQFGTTPSIIASDSTVHMVRFRTTDGSVIATCSAADGRMALTKSPY